MEGDEMGGRRERTASPLQKSWIRHCYQLRSLRMRNIKKDFMN